jgi:hypothetical protein
MKIKVVNKSVSYSERQIFEYLTKCLVPLKVLPGVSKVLKTTAFSVIKGVVHANSNEFRSLR